MAKTHEHLLYDYIECIKCLPNKQAGFDNVLLISIHERLFHYRKIDCLYIHGIQVIYFNAQIQIGNIFKNMTWKYGFYIVSKGHWGEKYLNRYTVCFLSKNVWKTNLANLTTISGRPYIVCVPCKTALTITWILTPMGWLIFKEFHYGELFLDRRNSFHFKRTN